MPEKVGESPYLTYIEPGLNKDDIQIVGHIHIVQYAQTPNGLAPIEEGGVQTSELGTLYKPVLGGDSFYDYDINNVVFVSSINPNLKSFDNSDTLIDQVNCIYDYNDLKKNSSLALQNFINKKMTKDYIEFRVYKGELIIFK